MCHSALIFACISLQGFLLGNDPLNYFLFQILAVEKMYEVNLKKIAKQISVF